jgi:hypothetical protein
MLLIINVVVVVVVAAAAARGNLKLHVSSNTTAADCSCCSSVDKQYPGGAGLQLLEKYAQIP